MRGLRWPAALLGSAALHLGGIAAAGLFVSPDEPAPQTTPEAQFTMQAQPVTRKEATPHDLSGEMLASQTPDAAPLSSGAIPLRKADQLTPLSKQVASITDDISQDAAEVIAAPTPLTTASALGTVAPVSEVVGRKAEASSPAGQMTEPVRITDEVAPSVVPQTQSLSAATAPVIGDRVISDPSSIAAFEALSSDKGGDQLRDDLGDLLAAPDCARLSAQFIPETGAVELRGHVPELQASQPVMSALRQTLGADIVVTQNILLLPKPQCGALAGIAELGLPQSTDQITNAKLIGAAAHAREYRYNGGQRLQFELTAPDYAAFVYVDYFDADGDVIHLTPNEIVPLARHEAKTSFGVGTEAPGQPGLNITIGPPYGQEIAVAFAASHALYDGLRPLAEPAAPYLSYLKNQIAAARAENPDFKGEWVYFFITTAP